MDFAKIDQWRRDGAINFEAEQRIVEAEGGSYSGVEALRWREALAYIGGLLVLGGGLALAFQLVTPDLFSGDEGSSGAILITLLVAAGLAGAAWNLDQGDPISDRIGAFLATASVVAVAGFAGILFFNVINPAEGSVLMFSVLTGAAAFAAWLWRPAVLTQLAMHISAWLAVIGVLIVVGLDDSSFGFFGFTGLGVLAGLLFLGLGIGWMALTYTGYLKPKLTGYVLGTLAASTGAQILLTVGTGWVIVELALGATLVAFGVRESRTVLVFFGSWIVATGIATGLGTLITGTEGVAIAAAVLGIAALLLALLMRDQGSWQAKSPMADASEESPF